MKLYLSLILFLPLAGGVINTVAGRNLPRRLVEIIACSVVWVAFISALFAFFLLHGPITVQLFSWLADFELSAPVSLHLDPLAMAMCLMVTFVCGLIHVYSVGYMAEDPGYARFFALMNLFVFAMLLLILADNLPLLYLGWEGVGFCSYALIGFWYADPNNATAGRKAFIVTRIGDTAFGIAIVWLFQLFHTVSIGEINGAALSMPGWIISTIGILLLVGAMGKSAQVPLMVWLPDAMAGPTPVSAQIHAATMVTAGVYILMRLYPFISHSQAAMTAIAVTGAVTAFYGASCAVAQRDLKRILAYSTISQIGYMILAVGVGAIAASLFHLIIHAFFKALLFLAAGCVILALHHEQDIFHMGGLRKPQPATFVVFLAGALALAGFPLTGGFFSKDAVLAAVLEHPDPLRVFLYVVGLATALLTSYYTFRLLYVVFGGEEAKKTAQVPKVMLLPLLPLALLALCGGLLDLPAYLPGRGLLSAFLGVPHEKSGAELYLQLVAAIVSIVGLLLAYARYGRGRDARFAEAAESPAPLSAFLFNGWYADRLYDFLFVRPYKLMARFLWERVDEGIIDGALDRIGDSCGNAGRRLAAFTNGRVSVYILGVALGLVAMVLFLVTGPGR